MAPRGSRADLSEGIVLEATTRHAVVLSGAERLRCIFRKELFRGPSRFSRPVAAGDRVRFSRPERSEPILEEVLPRRTWISRVRRMTNEEQIIVANPDRMFVVSSAAEPDFRPRLVDRLLATAERAAVPAVVIVNKVDLAADRPALEDWARLYRGIGYDALLVSSRTGEGVDAARALAQGGMTVVVGQSGVGKSSVLSAIAPDLRLESTPVSASGKGRHTTTRVTLHPFGAGAFLADSPGVRSFALAEPVGPDLSLRFREMTAFIDRCRFRDCLHAQEPACAVREAVGQGAIDPRRYASYLRMMEGDESDVPEDEE
jgi:ribosome biogenesis GTPase